MNPWRLAYFNLIAGGYSLLRRPSRAERDLVARLLGIAPGTGHLLEVGSGAGHHARDLLRRFPQLHVTACEPALLFRLASRLATWTTGFDRRLTHVGAPAERLPFPGATFEAGLCLFVLWAIDHREVAVAELARVIKPGGGLVIADFALPVPGTGRPRARLPFGHEPLGGPEELARLVEPCFTVVETERWPAALFAACRRNP